MRKSTRRSQSDRSIPASLGINDLTAGGLLQAELCFQRGEYDLARTLLMRRIGRGAKDFKTHNLYAICTASMYDFHESALLFENLYKSRKARHMKVKAGHNLALVYLYQDLIAVGDFSIAKSAFNSPTIAMANPHPMMKMPFTNAIETWEALLQKDTRQADILNAFLSFAYLQHGDLEQAVGAIIESLHLNENYYVSQYVLGKIFMDLFHLAMEGNDYLMTERELEFFEIGQPEIIKKVNNRFQVQQETFLEIALQSFIDAREINRYAPEVMVALCQAYLIAGMLEETQQTLAVVEQVAPDSLSVLDTQLLIQEQVEGDESLIRSLVNRIDRIRRKGMQYQVGYIIPAYYLL